MKPETPNQDEEPLNNLLNGWKVNRTLPPRFQEQVWRRIAVAEDRTKDGFLQRFIYWLEVAFTRPTVAVSYVAILIFLGLTTGYQQAQSKAMQTGRIRYVQSVDPYQFPRN